MRETERRAKRGNYPVSGGLELLAEIANDNTRDVNQRLQAIDVMERSQERVRYEAAKMLDNIFTQLDRMFGNQQNTPATVADLLRRMHGYFRQAVDNSRPRFSLPTRKELTE
jgi:type VI protein secretion system component VasK